MHAPVPALPSLNDGDRLHRDEFVRRWKRRPDIRRAELIDGTVVVMASPVSARHSEPHFGLISWLSYYRAHTPGLSMHDNITYLLPGDFSFQPDVAVCLPTEVGGNATLTEDGYLQGAADFVAEIANSSVSLDLNRKRDAYLRAGVHEYLVWRVEDNAIDWWRRDGERFEPIERGADGRRHSTVFPGLVLDDGLLFNRDFAGLLALMTAATTADPLHAALVERLSSSAADPP